MCRPPVTPLASSEPPPKRIRQQPGPTSARQTTARTGSSPDLHAHPPIDLRQLVAPISIAHSPQLALPEPTVLQSHT
eukprot:2017722-Pyramimonas_sp.AAC.1